MPHPQNYQEALVATKAIMKRDLVESENEISFIAYVSDYADYCLCSWMCDPADGWYFSCQLLPIEQRLPDEQITDDKIRDLAKSRNSLVAIRLYRIKYNSDLKTAKSAIDLILNS